MALAERLDRLEKKIARQKVRVIAYFKCDNEDETKAAVEKAKADYEAEHGPADDCDLTIFVARFGRTTYAGPAKAENAESGEIFPAFPHSPFREITKSPKLTLDEKVAKLTKKAAELERHMRAHAREEPPAGIGFDPTKWDLQMRNALEAADEREAIAAGQPGPADRP